LITSCRRRHQRAATEYGRPFSSLASRQSSSVVAPPYNYRAGAQVAADIHQLPGALDFSRQVIMQVGKQMPHEV